MTGATISALSAIPSQSLVLMGPRGAGARTMGTIGNPLWSRDNFTLLRRPQSNVNMVQSPLNARQLSKPIRRGRRG